MTKILLVEDDKNLREIYGVRLLAEGYDIVSAGDGEEALAMAIKERPALIVSDVMMPKISGFDMLDILQSTTETKNIKVIMMTALSGEDQRKRGEDLGAARYLVKSQVGIEDVVRAVHEVLGDDPSIPADGNANDTDTAPAPQSQQTTTPAAPAQAAAPTPQAEPTPAPPAAPAPAPSEQPQVSGERVVQPLPQSEQPAASFADRLEQELAQPQVTPVAAPTPSPMPAPSDPSPMQFEMTPPAPTAVPQPQPAAPAPQAAPRPIPIPIHPEPMQPQAAPMQSPQPPVPPVQ